MKLKKALSKVLHPLIDKDRAKEVKLLVKNKVIYLDLVTTHSIKVLDKMHLKLVFLVDLKIIKTIIVQAQENMILHQHKQKTK